MKITTWDKIRTLVPIYLSLFRLPVKYAFYIFQKPLDSVRYTEFTYLLKFLRRDRVVLKNVLDISSPYMMSYLLSKKATVIKTDISPEENKYIKPSEKLSFKIEDGTRLSFKDNTFDLVYSISVVEHIYEKYTKAIQEMIRVTKTGGLIYISCPVSKTHTEEWFESNIYSHQYQNEGKVFFQYLFDENDINSLINNLKDKEVLSKEVFWEKREGKFKRLVTLQKRTNSNKYLIFLRDAIVNLYYGFNLLNIAPGDFKDAKQFGNISIVFRKI